MSTGAATDVFALSRDEPAPADKALIRQKIKNYNFFSVLTIPLPDWLKSWLIKS
jgi:hypothetical protein